MATQRGYYRAELLRAIDNLEMALTHVSRLVDAYATHHPEVSSAALDICNAITMIGEAIHKLHDSI